MTESPLTERNVLTETATPTSVHRPDAQPESAGVEGQYATGISRQRIEQALQDVGKDLGGLQCSDLALLEEFHTMGRIATIQLAELADVKSDDEVLDAGSGVGGTARYLAGEIGCHVTAIDLTEVFCEISRWLNTLVGLDGLISVHRGDITELPFPSGTFTAVFSQHVQMNVADKNRLYSEAHRVLHPGGRLALWDVTLGAPGQLNFPLPWADRPEISHLWSPTALRAAIESAGFAVTEWQDKTEDALEVMEAFLSMPRNPLGLDLLVDSFDEKIHNLVHGVSTGRLRLVQGTAEAR